MTRASRYRASLGLNVLLAVVAAWLASSRFNVPAAPVAPAAARGAEAPPRAAPTAGHFVEDASPAVQRRWLVEQLRAMGVPLRVLGRVVQEDLDIRWNWHAIGISKKTYGDVDAMDAVQLEIDMTTDADMRAALGEQDFRRWDQTMMVQQMNFGGVQLSDAEIAAAYPLWKQLRKRELEIKQAKLKAEMDQADIGDALHEAVSEFEREMKALLGEERFAQSQGTDPGTTAADLRQNLAQANPSEAQFGELLKTQQRWNELRLEIDELYQDNRSSTEYENQVKALNEARESEYRRVLGDAVFESFQKEQHPSYSMMKRNANLWGLDDGKIDSVYATMRYYEKTVQDYQAQTRALASDGRTVDWAVMNKNLEQFTAQTHDVLRNYLGRETFAQMERNGVFRLKAPEGAPEMSARGSSR